MSTTYKDKFSEASKELQEKSGFVCETCKETYHKEAAVKKEMSCCGRTLKELVQESFGPWWIEFESLTIEVSWIEPRYSYDWNAEAAVAALSFLI